MVPQSSLDVNVRYIINWLLVIGISASNERYLS